MAIVCSLDQEQEDLLYTKVDTDLQAMAKLGEEFKLSDYMLETYNTFVDAGMDVPTAIAYVSVIPKNIKLLSGLDPAVDELIAPEISKVFALAAKIVDPDYAINYLKIVKDKVPDEILAEPKKEKEKPKVKETSDSYSFKPNSFNSTTGNSKDPIFKFSSNFIKHIIKSGKISSKLNGYYITLVNASEVFTDSDGVKKEDRTGVIQIITDRNGNPIHFNELYEPTTREEGRLVFFRLRGENINFEEAKKGLQSDSELQRTLNESSVDKINNDLKKQHALVQKKKNYVSADPSRKIIQEITGASNGFLELFPSSARENSLPLAGAEDLSDGSIIIEQQITGDNKKRQRYFFKRNDYSRNIPFSANSVESLGKEFLTDAASVILGMYVKDGEIVNVVDKNGSESNQNMITYRKDFLYRFFGNNYKVKIDKEGYVYVGLGKEAKRVSDDVEEAIEQIIQALTYDKNYKSSLNVSDLAGKSIPFFKKKDGVISLDDKGMTDKEYRKFIQNNSRTTARYDQETGQFVEENGYFTLRTPTDQVNKIEYAPKVETKKTEEPAPAPKIVGKAKGTIFSTIYELDPTITEDKLNQIYDNYVALMGRRREGKEMSREAFLSLAQKYQVYNYKDTYIFGNYDPNTGTFVTRVNSSPTSKELLAEAIPHLVEKGLDFISFVPEDYADKLVRSGYVKSKGSFLYNFKGEKMRKYAVASNANVFKKIFNKSAERVTGKTIEEYNDSIELGYVPVEIDPDAIVKAGKDAADILETYLKNFGISVKDINEIKDKLGIDEVGFADILSKIAYIKDRKNLPPVAGEFIAYMMQHNSLVKDIIVELSNTENYKELKKDEYLKVIGELIAKDLQNKLEGKYSESLIAKVKELVKKFLEFLGAIPVDLINKNIGAITNNIMQQNKRMVAASLYKPGAYGKMTKQVSIEDALAKDKFGASIIYELAKKGFILTGSTAISEQGTILRPDENPLHDIDWVSPFNRKETAEKFYESYPDAIKVRDIVDLENGYVTDSYLIAPEGYSISDFKTVSYADKDGKVKILIDSYDVLDSSGSIVGTYRLEKDEKGKNKEVVTGVEAKVIDFFTYEKYEGKNKNKPLAYTSKEGTVIQLANWKDIFAAKLEWARYKDIWDYNRFIPNPPANENEKAQPIEPTPSSLDPELQAFLDDDIDFQIPDIDDDNNLNKLRSQVASGEKITQEQLDKAIEWWYSDQNVLKKFISLNLAFDQINPENPQSIARFFGSAITLYEGSTSADLYHEAWHAFTQRFLPKAELKRLYAETRKMSGSFTDFNGKTVMFSDPSVSDKQLEEFLAEDFRKFMLKGGKTTSKNTPVKNSVFQTILDLLKILFNFALTDSASSTFAGFDLHEYYNNLRTGNIMSEPIGLDPAFSPLDKINPVTKTSEKVSDSLSYSDAMLIVDSIDSFFSDYEDEQNALNGNSEYTSKILSDPKERASAYNRFLKDVIEKYKNITVKRRALLETDPKYASTLRKEIIYKFIIQNFSEGSVNGTTVTVKDIQSTKEKDLGVIAYHMRKSKYLNFEDSYLIDDPDDKKLNDRDGYGHKAGNEVSMKELAETEILYTIRSLFDYKDGKRTKNELGFYNLADFDSSWNKIQNALEGANDIIEQYDILEAKADEDPMFRQLVSKLGNPNRYSTSEFKNQDKEGSIGNIILLNNLWTNFSNALGGVRIPLVQLTLNLKQDPQTGKISDVEVKPGKAQNKTDKVARDFESNFSNPTILGSRRKYINTRPEIMSLNESKSYSGNTLNIENIVDDFESTYRYDPIPFLTALGMDVPDTPEVKRILTGSLKVFPESLMKKLVAFRDNNALNSRNKIVIRSIKDLIDTQYNGKNETTTYKNFLDVIVKNSDKYSDALISTASGKARWELSLKSSISQMINSWNSSEDFDDLISQDRMSFLNPDRNVYIKNLIIARDTFGDDLSKKVKQVSRSGREKKAGIELLNSAGVALLLNGNGTDIYSESSEADEITQMLQNFYSYVIYGVSEGTRHADKATSYWYRVIFPDGRNHYIPMESFAAYNNLEDPEQDIVDTSGMNMAVDQFMRYLSSEVERIYKLSVLDDVSGNALVGDSTYKEIGSNFHIFEDIIEKSILDDIKKNHLSGNFYDELTKKPEMNKLYSKIHGEITNYLMTQVDKFRDDIAGLPIFNDEALFNPLKEKVLANGATQKIINDPEKYNDFIIKSLLTGYVVNDWIQKFETTALFYGDPALYNHLKEEFHKRNPSIAATGTIPRSDYAMNELLDGPLEGKYLASEWFAASGLTGTNAKATNRMRTAVLQDAKMDSVYVEDYIKAAIKSEKKRLGKKSLTPEEEDKIRTLFKEYMGMKTGDAQGWISFDSYRALLNRLGKWGPQQENLYNDILAGKDVSTQDIKRFFPVKKMQYAGPLANDLGLPLVGFHKFSLVPLIPTLIKGTNLETLHNKMASQNIDYATFVTGSKISTITKNGKADLFYDQNGEPAFAKDDYEFTPNEIFIDYLKDQLETADEYKNTTIFSTQLRKLIEIGLMENGVPIDFRPEIKEKQLRIYEWDALDADEKLNYVENSNYKKLVDYEKSIEDLVEYNKRKLIKESGITVTEQNNYLLNNKFLEFVKNELTRQDLAEHEIDFIQYDRATGQLVYDLSFHPSADKIERLLSAMVYKRLVRQKVNGEPLIQVSGVGFEPSGKLRKATDEEEKIYNGTNSLPFYNQDETGKTRAMKVKISIQGDFKKLLKHPAVRDRVREKKNTITPLQALNELIKEESFLNQGDNRKMITLAGVRIPVQGLNSMEFAEVYEFLPENSGNIIILPAEIVGKSGSDFDIDKLTMMFPSLVSTSSGVYLSKYNKADEDNLENNQKLLDKLYTERDAVIEKLKVLGTDKIKKDIDRLKAEKENIKNEIVVADLTRDQSLGDIFYTALLEINDELDTLYEVLENVSPEAKEIVKNELKPLLKDIDTIKVKIDSGKSKGIENNLLFSVVDILSLESNFVDLITPNSTELVKDLATKYSPFVRDYNPYETVSDGESYTYEKNGKQEKRISATRIFELGYNRYKQISNNIGKRTLGIGAVDNTYNAIFNKIGFYLNPTFVSHYSKEKVGRKVVTKPEYSKQIIRMPHNTIKVDGETAISLADLYDVDQKNNISTIISQMINGWVDVAKDSWIFDVQGNVEISPTLLFMIQAGVPLDQAVAFVSQPVIREYVKKQRFNKSTFSVLMSSNKSFERAKKYRAYARMDMINDLGLAKKKITNPNSVKKELYSNFIPKILGQNGNQNSIDMTEKNIFSLANLDERIMSKNMNDEDKRQMDIMAFLHFLELEDMAGATTEVKLSLNYDTTKTSSIYEAREKLTRAEVAELNTRVPGPVMNMIEKNTPIGSFKIQPFMIEIIGDLFDFRDDSVIRNFITDNLSNYDYKRRLPGAFKDKESFVNKFINDFSSYLFQQGLYNEPFDRKGSYKGATIEETSNLQRGAFAKKVGDKYVLYVDFKKLDKDFKDKSYTKEVKGDPTLFLSKVESTMFAHKDPEVAKNLYYKFVYERESLRYMIPYDKFKETALFEASYEYTKSKTRREKDETVEVYKNRVGQITYENFLRDTALTNNININFMMRGSNGYAAQVAAIQSIIPNIRSTFRVLSSLKYKVNHGTKNLRFSEMSMDPDTVNMYYEDMENLANPNVAKSDNSLENQIITSVFSKFHIFALLQSGQDTKGVYSMAKIANPKKVAQLLEKYSNNFLSQSQEDSEEELVKYFSLFKKQYGPVVGNDEEEQIYVKRSKNYYMQPPSKGFNIDAVEEDDSFISDSLSNPGSKEYNFFFTDTYENIVNSLKQWAEESPENEIMIYSKPYGKQNTKDKSYTSTKKVYASSIISDLIAEGELPANKFFGISTKSRGLMRTKSDFMSVDTKDQLDSFKETLDAEIEQIVDMTIDSDNPKVLIFSKDGYGLSLMGYGRSEVVAEENKMMTTPPAEDAYMYLSEKLFDVFGYTNPFFEPSEKASEANPSMEEKISNEEIKDIIYECFYT